MLDRTRKVVALSNWSIEKRGRYWYIHRPQFFTEPAKERGPYGSALSAGLMIGRELAKEAVKRLSQPQA